MIAHVRIAATTEEEPCRERWIHTADVLAWVKVRHEQQRDAASIQFFQHRSALDPTAYPPGTELVVALLSGGNNILLPIAVPSAVFLVRQHRVHKAMPSSLGARYEGMQLATFLEEVRKMVQQ